MRQFQIKTLASDTELDSNLQKWLNGLASKYRKVKLHEMTTILKQVIMGNAPKAECICIASGVETSSMVTPQTFYIQTLMLNDDNALDQLQDIIQTKERKYGGVEIHKIQFGQSQTKLGGVLPICQVILSHNKIEKE